VAKKLLIHSFIHIRLLVQQLTKRNFAIELTVSEQSNTNMAGVFNENDDDNDFILALSI